MGLFGIFRNADEVRSNLIKRTIIDPFIKFELLLLRFFLPDFFLRIF